MCKAHRKTILNRQGNIHCMRLAVLFSGGKDSVYALAKAMETDKVVCLVTVVSRNKESYMFHTPNVHITELQAEAIGLPLVKRVTEGKKEEELDDLEDAIREAKKRFAVEGIVTGAIASVYQSQRVQVICDRLGLWCFNPLWQKDEVELLNELVDNKFEVIISGVFAYPFDSKWLGRKLDRKMIKELVSLKEKYQIHPSGEGGEIETLVVNAPFFRKRVGIRKSEAAYGNNAGVFNIVDAELE